MKLGMEVDPSQGHTVLDKDLAPPLQKGAQLPQFSAFRPTSVVAKWLDG